MPVSDEEIALVLVLQVDPITQGAVVIAQMDLPGRAHTGQNTPGLGGRTHSPALYGRLRRPCQAPPTANPGKRPRPWRSTTGGDTARSTTVVGSMPQFPESSTASIWCSRRARISRPSVSGVDSPGRSSVELMIGSPSS